MKFTLAVVLLAALATTSPSLQIATGPWVEDGQIVDNAIFFLSDSSQLYVRWPYNDVGWVELDIPEGVEAIDFTCSHWVWGGEEGVTRFVLTADGEIWFDIQWDGLPWDTFDPPTGGNLTHLSSGIWNSQHHTHSALFTVASSGEVFVHIADHTADWESLGFPDGSVPVKGTSWGGLKSRFE